MGYHEGDVQVVHCARCEELRAADPIEGDLPYRAGFSVLASLMFEDWNRIQRWIAEVGHL